VKFVATNRMGDQHVVEAESLDQAREAAVEHFRAWAKDEWAGCWSKRQRAAIVETVVPQEEQ